LHIKCHEVVYINTWIDDEFMQNFIAKTCSKGVNCEMCGSTGGWHLDTPQRKGFDWSWVRCSVGLFKHRIEFWVTQNGSLSIQFLRTLFPVIR